MTEFIIANACADVSARLRARLIDEIRQGGRATLIVPDQYAFETEKALYRSCRDTGIPQLFSNISVRTFSKLSEEIIARYAGGKKAADDITKNILMYRAVSEIHDSLSSLGRIALKPGFAPKMTGTVAMLKAAGMTADKLHGTVDAVKEDFRDSAPALFAKLTDISMIYSAYDALLSQSYTDKLDSTSAAARLAAENGVFRGESIYCDGFSDFSQSQMSFLFTVIDLAENVTFAFTSENGDGCRDIFSTVNDRIAALASHSEQAGAEVKGADVFISKNDRKCSAAVSAVSQNIFTDEKADSTPDGVSVIRADDCHAEADYVAAEIRRLVTEEGLRYSEIAVLSADPAQYRTPIESSFDKYGIPLFCDMPESILHMPLVNLLLSLLETLNSFTAESFLSYIKSGFIQKSDGRPLTMREINDIEDYIYEWGLKGEDLKQPFPEINGKIPRAEKLRADIVPPLLALREQLKNCTGDEITKRVCDFLFDVVGVQRAVAAHCKTAGSELLTDSDKKMIASYQTLWNTVLEILEGLYKGLEGYKISVAEYRTLVRDICAGATLAGAPQTLDSVLAGDISRTRVDNVKAVFIMGATYDRFPENESGGGIFSEYETELLSDSIMKLGMNRRERYCYNRYLAYRALSLPTERLYVTYPVLDAACTKKSPSDIIAMLENIFGQSLSINAGALSDEFYCSSSRAAQQRFAAMCKENTERRATLKKALQLTGNGGFADKLEKLVSDRDGAFSHRLSPETAEALFRSNTFSATKLERLNHCRFEYFCSNGLRVRERSKRDLSRIEIGNAVHYVLQKTLEKYCNAMNEFIAMSRAALSAEARHFLDEYKTISLGGDYAKSLRFAYLYKNLTVGAVDMLILLQAEFAARDYRPKFFELQIGGEEDTAYSPAGESEPLDIAAVPDAALYDSEEVSFPETAGVEFDSRNTPGSSRTKLNTPALKIHVRDKLDVNITGIIDRADIFTDEHGNEYIRVVDYKTGKREFSMVNVYYGINTQMLLYLIAVCNANKELRAGGVSYLPAKVTEPSSKKSAAFALLSQDHIQSGMYVRSDAAEREMTKYAENISARSGIKREKFMPAEDSALTEEQFTLLSEECTKQTREVLCRLYDGDVDAVPTVYKEKYTEKKACSYCRFASVCGHNEQHETRAVPREEQTDGKEGAEVAAEDNMD